MVGVATRWLMRDNAIAAIVPTTVETRPTEPATIKLLRNAPQKSGLSASRSNQTSDRPPMGKLVTALLPKANNTTSASGDNMKTRTSSPKPRHSQLEIPLMAAFLAAVSD